MTEITKEQLEKAIVNANSTKEVLQNLGLNVVSSNYTKIDFLGRKYGIEIPKSYVSKTPYGGKKLSDEEYFAKDTKRNGPRTLERLINDHGRELKCYGIKCPVDPEFLKTTPMFDVDHINGDHFDNRIENLEILCPVCHRLTPTYRGGNRKVSESKYDFCKCGMRKGKDSLRCYSCRLKKSREEKYSWPDLNGLLSMLEQEPIKTVAEKIGVSDNGLRKKLSREGIDPGDYSWYNRIKK